MALKRQLKDGGGEEGSRLPIKRLNLASTVFKGPNYARTLQEFMEPRLRNLVQEAVECEVEKFLRSSSDQIDCPGSRTLQLKFQSDLPHTLFTCSRIVSEDRCPVRIVLYESSSRQIITSGPLASAKAHIVVLDGDFGPEEWTKNEFERKIVQTREGKRPLVTGELIVQLQNGVGYIGDVSFTDNSSWIRSGKFRLGLKVHLTSDEISIREGMSNAFKVKDHRGESYQKNYPPCLDDEVWRLEKIAKDGIYHKKLSQFGITSVRDFLRLYVTNQFALRNILRNVSNKTWKTIIRHATNCTLDDKKYMYTTPQGTVLFFNSIHEVVGAIFNGESYTCVESFDVHQMLMVEELKQHAYGNSTDFVSVFDSSIAGYPMLMPAAAAENFNNLDLGLENANLQVGPGQHEMPMIRDHPLVSPLYKSEAGQDNSFEFGESSHRMQDFNLTFRNSFGMTDSPGGFCNWSSGGNYMSQQLSADDLPVTDHFQVVSPASRWDGLFVGPTNQENGVISSNTGLMIPRNRRPKTRWCKVLAVVKWRILVKRNVAARKWNLFYNCT